LDELDKLNANINHKCNKRIVRDMKQKLIDKIKPLVKEDQWIEFLQTIEKDQLPDF
jgi:hypothetical protein